MHGAGFTDMGGTLIFTGGKYALSVGLGYTVEYTVGTGYDGTYTYQDFFQFTTAVSVAGPAPLASDPPMTLVGTSGSDALTGGSAADLLTGLAGNDTLNGASGADTAIFSGERSGYVVTQTAGGFSVAGADGTDTLSNVERLQFGDRSVNLTVGSTAHTITSAQLDSLVELYIAYINRVPDADGMAFWIGQLQAGQSLNQIGESFYAAALAFPSFKGHATFGFVADLLDNKIAVGKTFAIDRGLVYNTPEASISQGMAIAAAVTPASTAAAIALIGVTDSLDLY